MYKSQALRLIFAPSINVIDEQMPFIFYEKIVHVLLYVLFLLFIKQYFFILYDQEHFNIVVMINLSLTSFKCFTSVVKCNQDHKLLCGMTGWHSKYTKNMFELFQSDLASQHKILHESVLLNNPYIYIYILLIQIDCKPSLFKAILLHIQSASLCIHAFQFFSIMPISNCIDQQWLMVIHAGTLSSIPYMFTFPMTMSLHDLKWSSGFVVSCLLVFYFCNCSNIHTSIALCTRSL